MASLRRPSHYFGKLSHSDSRAPLPRDEGRKRDVRQSKVEDRMKTRRMSMRYAGPESFGVPEAGASLQAPYKLQYTLDVAPPIMEQLEEEEYAEVVAEPASIPTRSSPGIRPGSLYTSSPNAFVQAQLEEAEEPQEEEIRRRRPTLEQEWDFTALAKDNVDIGAYVRKTLTGADEREKKRLLAALQKQKESLAKDMQKNVFKNYAEFVSISKEISTLENDMLELKELLNEWKAVPQLMGMEDTLAPTIDKDGNVERHRSRRNSPMDLQQMYRSQLTNLWSTVEGSQKYINVAPGRHVVFETHEFLELHPATYKPNQSVSLFLLNDLLLVAGRRRLKTRATATDQENEKGRMVAEKCWALTDLVVVDVKDTGDLMNALKIKRGKEVSVFRASRPEDKKALLGAFRQVSSELAEKRRKENEAEQERRRTLWNGDDSRNARLTRMTMFMDIDTSRPLSTIGTSLSDSKDLLWIDEFSDDLTMAIATRDWGKGVKLVEHGQDLQRTVSSNKEASEMLKFRLESLRPSLVTRIADDLSLPDIRKATAGELIGLLTRLGKAELARDTFLKARHKHMLRLVRAIKHEGDVSLYINELAIVCFSIVRHTSDWYMSAFSDSRLASGFVTWAKEQIEYFADTFRRQVFAPGISQSNVDECHRVTAAANRKLLRDAGLDFTFLITSLTAEADQDTKASLDARTPTDFHADFVPGSSAVRGSPRNRNTDLDPANDLSRGSTAPLSLGRKSRPDAGSNAGSRNVSAASGGVSPGSPGSPAPRPPPRSVRRSRPPPQRE